MGCGGVPILRRELQLYPTVAKRSLQDEDVTWAFSIFHSRSKEYEKTALGWLYVGPVNGRETDMDGRVRVVAAVPASARVQVLYTNDDCD